MNIKAQNKRRSAFSLLELLAVVTIIGIITVVVIPRIGSSTQKTMKEACQQYKADINAAVERYLFHEGSLPSLDDLHDAEYLPDGIPLCPVTKTKYSLDPDSGRVLGHKH